MSATAKNLAENFAKKASFKFFATILLVISVILAVTAFVTPNWLKADDNAPVKKFDKMGLWEACFHSFFDTYHLYDLEFEGCDWIFDPDINEDMYPDLFNEPHFVATQVFYTLGVAIQIFSCFGLIVIKLYPFLEHKHLTYLILSVTLFISTLSNTVAVVIFGVQGDDRYWMPTNGYHYRNYLSWSYICAAVAALLQWFSTILFAYECRTLYKKRDKNQGYEPQPHNSDAETL